MKRKTKPSIIHYNHNDNYWKKPIKFELVLPYDELKTILQAVDAALWKEQNEYHWVVCALQTPNTPFEGSVLQNLHRKAAELEKAKDHLIDLFDKQYEKFKH